MTHVEIAASKGMKAGYKARKRVLKRGGLSTTRAALRESFGDYCAKFGPEVTATQSTMRNKPRNARVVGVEVFAEDVETSLADELATVRQRAAELEAELAKPKATPKATPKTTKVNTWHGWAVRKHNIPTQVGAEFSYKGKRRTSTFRVTKVTRDGSVESIRVS